MQNCSLTQNLSRALLELHNPGPHADFPARLFASLRLCFACDFYSFNEWTDKNVERIEIYPNWDVSLKLFKDYLNEHPSIAAIYQKRLKSAVKVSDFVSLTQWRQVRLHDEFFRLRNQKYQLTFVSAEQLPKLAVSLNRAGTNFTQEERSLLNLLRPHFIQAYRESRVFSYLNQAAGISNDGFIVVDRAWRIRYVNARGLALLKDFFGQEPVHTLPARIGCWLQEKLRSRSAAEPPVPDLSVGSDQRALTIQSVADSEGAEYRLLLRETARPLDARPLQSLGLTTREAEVLLWLSQGKSNSEIAIILTTKVRTIAKHLERVFAKLMVENRTAAAHAAMEVLRA
ncbi:MAG: helix-turn-helix transcriptional regulator [Verrucomicrobia bacterium]|nr:helix-turn-helix transcriptional regulator [Verrucomicrobiota bacterium]MBV8278868.1 helix-turn-helix transcriptional regulator [Verrucomicrobiota bacterium]